MLSLSIDLHRRGNHLYPLTRGRLDAFRASSNSREESSEKGSLSQDMSVLVHVVAIISNNELVFSFVSFVF